MPVPQSRLAKLAGKERKRKVSFVATAAGINSGAVVSASVADQIICDRQEYTFSHLDSGGNEKA